MTARVTTSRGARAGARGASRLLLAAAVAVFALSPLGAARADEPTCVTCHRRLTEAFLRAPLEALRDVHGSHEVGCPDCHRGRPDEPSMRAHDPGSGFNPGNHGFAQITMCGACHDGSQEELEDVLSAYRGGSHMRAVTEGKPGARCSDCHGSHGVLPPDDPQALTVRANVPHTCGSCHALMGPDIPSDQLRQWSTSVHGRAFAEGDEDAPTCATCHDHHDNQAGLAAVGACGECHEDIRAAFDEGPHAEHFRGYGFLDCVECHGSHEVRSPDATLLTGSSAACSRCHRRGQEPFDSMREIAREALRGDRGSRALDRADPRRVAYIGALHRLDVEAIRQAVSGLPVVAQPEAAAADPRLRDRAPPAWKPVAIGAALAIVAAGIALAWSRRRRSDR